MRVSFTVAAAALMLTPWATIAQDSEPAAEGAPASETAAAAPAAPPPFKHDKDCMDEVSSELVTFLGEPVAWPEEGHTVHRPAGLTVLGHPVSYVLVKRGGPGGRIDELGYRLEGMQRKVGQAHDAKLLRAFDDKFDGAECARSTESSCGVIYEGKNRSFTGAEIGSGEIDVARNARGPSLSLVKADYDLLDSDPVFLVCFYRGEG